MTLAKALKKMIQLYINALKNYITQDGIIGMKIILVIGYNEIL